MKQRKRHWLHLTETDHGNRWVASRIAPPDIGKDEPATPRLCVASSASRCLSASLFRPDEPVHIYRTAKRRSAIRPVGVWDAGITQERWIIPPCEMVRVGTLEPEIVFAAQESSRVWTCWKRCMSPKARLLGLRDAVEAMDRLVEMPGVRLVEPSDRRALKRIAAERDWLDPEPLYEYNSPWWADDD